jgi:hypothetical protein
VVLPPRESTTVTTKDIITNLQTLIASANTVESTRATWQNAVKADKDERAKLKAFGFLDHGVDHPRRQTPGPSNPNTERYARRTSRVMDT